MGQTIGIDFGTTNTVVSYKNKRGKIICLRDKDSKKCIPTALYFITENDYVIGTEALALAEANNTEPIVSFKSHLDEKFRYTVKSADGRRFKIGPKKATGYFISKVITSVQDRIIKTFGPAEGFIEKAIITVPAKFSHSAKESIKEAAIEAGLKNVELAFEPTAAAAAAYQTIEEAKSESTMIVYDFGGGTFDISIMKATKKDNHVKYDQLYTSGDKALGGNDVTFLIASDILDKVNEEFDLDMELEEDGKGLYRILNADDYDGSLPYDDYAENMRRIIDCAESVKISYETGNDIVNIKTEDGIEPYVYEYTTGDIEKIISPLIKKTIKITRDSLQYAKENDFEPDSIVLAGGSSNIPLVHKELEKFMNLDVELLDEVTELISKGAVVLNENKMNEVSNITSCSYGVISKEVNIFDKFIPIIPVNTTLPVKAERTFYLNSDNQEKLEIKLYEHDIQNYPNARRAMSEGIDVDQVFEINLPAGLKRIDTEIRLMFLFEKDGSLSIEVNVFNKGNLINNKEISVNKDMNLE
ncbi:MAG: Hsp70 family protein [Porcipelethomonas sp.]